VDARTYFLALHAHAHGDATFPTSPGAQILQISQPEFLRAKLPGFNSIAWLIWHVARGEDWGINAMVRGEEQVLHRESWGDRLGIERLDWGFGMSDADVTELSQSLDLDALRGYFDAVGAATRSFMETFDFDDLDAPLDVEARLATVPESLGPTPEELRTLVTPQTTNRWFINVLSISDVYLHWGEVATVAGTLRAARRGPSE
jgi:hypothetical protein